MVTPIRFIFLAAIMLAANSYGASFEEPPYLADRVSNGELQPVQERLPAVPLVMDESMGNITTGRYGGKMRMLMAKEKDIRRMVVFGYDGGFWLRPCCRV
jgi:peptide/nickel transport system substrate-binding protein